MKKEGNLFFCEDCDEVKRELLERNKKWIGVNKKWMDFNNSMSTIMITCIDSRVPVEKIFDLNPGEVLVYRNAGNIITRDVIRSVIIAALKIRVKNIIVMGHTRCGMAIADRNDKIKELMDNLPPNFMTYFDLKSEDDVKEFFGFFNNGDWEKNAVKNAKILEEELMKIYGENSIIPEVIAAVYDLDTGRVKFLDNI